MWYAGIDWADTHHVVVVLDEQGQQVATKQVAHTVEGLAQLTTFLLGIVGTSERLEELACIIETNHGLLIAALTSGRISRLSGLPAIPFAVYTRIRKMARNPGVGGGETDGEDTALPLCCPGSSKLGE